MPGQGVPANLGGGCMPGQGAPANLASQQGAPQMLQEGAMLSGRVKVWYDNKGFGFLIPDGGGPDVFVHARALQDGQALVAGSTVMFEVTQEVSGKFRARSCMGAVARPAEGSAPVSVPNENLFVSGLPHDVSEENIKEVFAPYGMIASVRLLPENGRPDRAALVKVSDVEQAQWMVDNLNQNIRIGSATSVCVRFSENRSARGRDIGFTADVGNRFSPYGAGGLDTSMGQLPQQGIGSLSDLAMAAAFSQLTPNQGFQLPQNLMLQNGLAGLGPCMPMQGMAAMGQLESEAPSAAAFPPAFPQAPSSETVQWA